MPPSLFLALRASDVKAPKASKDGAAAISTGSHGPCSAARRRQRDGGHGVGVDEAAARFVPGGATPTGRERTGSGTGSGARAQVGLRRTGSGRAQAAKSGGAPWRLHAGRVGAGGEGNRRESKGERPSGEQIPRSREYRRLSDDFLKKHSTVIRDPTAKHSLGGLQDEHLPRA